MNLPVIKGKNEFSLYELALRICIKFSKKSNLNKTDLESTFEYFTKDLSPMTTMGNNGTI